MSAADEAWREWQEANPDWWANRTEAGFMAGYRRALEDAADDIAEADFNGFFDIGSMGVGQVRDWLRDTAAAVTPRETKD